MIIRDMTFADITQVYSITCTSLDEEYVPEVFDLFMNFWPSGQLVATDAAGNVIGYIAGTRLTADKVSVALLAVDIGHRNRGVGNALLNTFRTRAAMDGKRTVQLEVRDCNTDAIRFYERRGFIKVELVRSFYQDGGDAIRMICNIVNNV